MSGAIFSRTTTTTGNFIYYFLNNSIQEEETEGEKGKLEGGSVGREEGEDGEQDAGKGRSASQ